MSLPQFKPRLSDSHKGTYGHGLLIGGCRGMAGAVAIAAQATLRSGAGLVTVAVPDLIADLVASFSPCYMTVPLSCDSLGRITLEAIERIRQQGSRVNAIGVGPGMGQSEELLEFIATLYVEMPQAMVVDADALNLLGMLDAIPKAIGPRILTPHPGEFERLTSVSASNREQQTAAAVQLASELGVVIVLKGHRTVVTDGNCVATNATGHPAMAVGGSGDCLTGVILALLCQGLSSLDASRLGAHVHGLAGEIAHQRIAGPSVLATDIIDSLPSAFSSLSPDVNQV